MSLLLAVLMAGGTGLLHSTPGEPDFQLLGEEAVRLLAEYLQIDTTNPPGNELHGIELLADVLNQEGIPYEIAESAAGRGNLYARLQGDGSREPLILLHHVDVVPAEARFWSVPPFEGRIDGGYVWGRGALDSKSLGVVHLVSFLTLKRSELPLKRDVILLATADEEAGGFQGVAWILRNRPEWVSDARFVLNEGGNNLVRNDRLVYVGVEVAQKIPVWLRLSVEGRSGHGSVPERGSAAEELVRALDRVLRYPFPVHLTPGVAQYFRNIAPFQPGNLRNRFARIEDSVKSPDFVDRLSPFHGALLRNTVALTVLQAGLKTNVVPPVAVAELDCRLLPDQDPAAFVKLIHRVVNNPRVQIEVLLSFSPSESSTDTELFGAIRKAVARVQPEATVGLSVLAGFTDSHFFREQGMTAYGFDPFTNRENQLAGVHGVDERISIESLHFGVRFFYNVLSELVH